MPCSLLWNDLHRWLTHGFPYLDEHLDIIYINEKLNRDEWHTFEIGKTRFNDEGLRQAGKNMKPHIHPQGTKP